MHLFNCLPLTLFQVVCDSAKRENAYCLSDLRKDTYNKFKFGKLFFISIC